MFDDATDHKAGKGTATYLISWLLVFPIVPATSCNIRQQTSFPLNASSPCPLSTLSQQPNWVSLHPLNIPLLFDAPNTQIPAQEHPTTRLHPPLVPLVETVFLGQCSSSDGILSHKSERCFATEGQTTKGLRSKPIRFEDRNPAQ